MSDSITGRSDQPIGRRKDEHIDIVRDGAVEVPAPVSWDEIHLLHCALPEIDRDDVRLDLDFLGYRLKAPLVIASMTGGTERAELINRRLGAAAERFGLAMGLGSGRIMLDDPTQTASFRVAREVAPTAFLYANIGAPQLIANGGRAAYRPETILRLVEAIEAQALAVHLNYLQECVQPEGDTRARGILAAIGELVRASPVPIIVKEVGNGINRQSAQALVAAGVAAIDVGGQGGTSWALVEAVRAEAAGQQRKARLGRTFAGWGIPTAVAIRLVSGAGRPVIATGGIRSGLDAARALALGADLVGVARPLLQAALVGEDALDEWLAIFLDELRTALFLTGSVDLATFHGCRPIITGRVAEWLGQIDDRA